MAQCAGYLFAAAGPVTLGALHAATDGWTVPVLVLLALTVPILAVGVLAGRDVGVGHRPAGTARSPAG